jgi:hypothetical protein
MYLAVFYVGEYGYMGGCVGVYTSNFLLHCARSTFTFAVNNSLDPVNPVTTKTGFSGYNTHFSFAITLTLLKLTLLKSEYPLNPVLVGTGFTGSSTY